MYKTMLQIAEAQSVTIAQRAVAIMQTKYNLYTVQVERTLVTVKAILQMQLRYLESNDLTQWKQFVATVVNAQVERGLSYIDVIKAGHSIGDALDEFFEEQFATKAQTDPEAEAALKKLQRRMRGFRMVAVSTATATGIKEINWSGN